jgi:hypothetical protein
MSAPEANEDGIKIDTTPHSASAVITLLIMQSIRRKKQGSSDSIASVSSRARGYSWSNFRQLFQRSSSVVSASAASGSTAYPFCEEHTAVDALDGSNVNAATASSSSFSDSDSVSVSSADPPSSRLREEDLVAADSNNGSSVFTTTDTTGSSSSGGIDSGLDCADDGEVAPPGIVQAFGRPLVIESLDELAGAWRREKRLSPLCIIEGSSGHWNPTLTHAHFDATYHHAERARLHLEEVGGKSVLTIHYQDKTYKAVVHSNPWDAESLTLKWDDDDVWVRISGSDEVDPFTVWADISL